MRVLAVFSGLFIAFHILFWQEGAGINLALFLGLSGSAFFLIRGKKGIKINWFLLLSAIIASVAMVLLHTTLALAVFVLTATAFLSSLHQAGQSVIETFLNGFLNFFNPNSGIIPGFSLPEGGLRKKRGLLYVRIAGFPLLILLLYVLLFSAGNSIFSSYTGGILEQMTSWFTHFSFPHVMFIILGVLLCRWILRTEWVESLNLNPKSSLLREKRLPHKGHKMALKYEYYRAVALFAAINALFAFVNFIDVKWVWFQFNITNSFDLKAFVHEGTGYLIFTLLLSIGLILYFFRQNLNFYPKSVWLKRLAYLWIAQNAVLAISVIIRTAYYIDFHGLASKRIALLVFISMVIFGLASLVYKIAYKRNFASLLRLNGSFIMAILVVCACVPWNITVAKHNLNHHNPHEIDVDNYLKLGPAVYPLLYANLDVIDGQIKAHKTNEVTWIRTQSIESFKQSLDQRSTNFLEREAKESLWSWNLAESRAQQALAAVR
jgi:hypothetical protein